jgi:hypothetical protein
MQIRGQTLLREIQPGNTGEVLREVVGVVMAEKKVG